MLGSSRRRVVLVALLLAAFVAPIGAPAFPRESEVSDLGWYQHFPESTPGAREGAEMAYLPSHEQLVLYGAGGSTTASSPMNDTWVWEGLDWRRVVPAHSPPNSRDVDLAYDAAGSRLLLFLGGTAESPTSQTWTWNGSDWTRLQPLINPPARTDFAMAQGPNKTIVLFGGSTIGPVPSVLNDTWVWNGTTWQQRIIAAPTLSNGTTMGYDAGRDETVLFGGDTPPTPQTWVWNGTSWAEKAPVHSPQARRRGAMAYADGEGLVLFGGRSDAACHNDTWTWSGSDWREIQPTSRPSCRTLPAMAYDPRFDEIVLHGGGNLNAARGDTWATTTETVWEDLGGRLVGAPGVSSWGVGRLDVVVRGTDNQLWHAWFDRGWRGWESLGGVLTDEPASVSWSPGRFDVFVRGTDNALWHRWYDGTWHGWESLGGVLTSAPAATAWGPHRLDVFVRGSDNALWHRWWDGRAWSHWESLGGVLVSKPAVDVFPATPGNLSVDVKGTDQEIWRRSHSFSSGWTAWRRGPGGGPWATGPAVAAGQYFVVDDNTVWNARFAGDEWIPLYEDATSAAAAVSWGGERMDVFVRGPNGGLSHAWSRREPAP